MFDSRVTCPDLHYSDILTLSWLAHRNKQVKTVGMHTTMALELASHRVIGTLKCNTDSCLSGKAVCLRLSYKHVRCTEFEFAALTLYQLKTGSLNHGPSPSGISSLRSK